MAERSSEASRSGSWSSSAPSTSRSRRLCCWPTSPRSFPSPSCPCVVLRYLGEGHFYARNDRSRLRGLSRRRSTSTVRSAARRPGRVLTSAGTLLHSPDVALPAVPALDRRRSASLRRSRSPTTGSGSRSRDDVGASPSTTATGPCSMRWPRSEDRPVQRRAVCRAWSGRRTTSRSSRAAWVKDVCHRRVGEITFMNPAGSEHAGMGGRASRWARPRQVATPRFLLDPALRAMSPAPERHQRRHSLRTRRRLVLPRDHDGVARRRRVADLGRRARVP